MAISNKDTIERLASSVYDNGRRGMPKQGCDCVQCFGYCAIDKDEAIRARFDRGARIDVAAASTTGNAALDLERDGGYTPGPVGRRADYAAKLHADQDEVRELYRNMR
jgi:hypothetical protein